MDSPHRSYIVRCVPINTSWFVLVSQVSCSAFPSLCQCFVCVRECVLKWLIADLGWLVLPLSSSLHLPRTFCPSNLSRRFLQQGPCTQPIVRKTHTNVCFTGCCLLWWCVNPLLTQFTFSFILCLANITEPLRGCCIAFLK